MFSIKVINRLKKIDNLFEEVKKMINLITDYFDMCKVNLQFFLSHGWKILVVIAIIAIFIFLIFRKIK